MSQRSSEQWRFSVHSPRADRVFLVQRGSGGASAWVEMQRGSQGTWSVLSNLSPGDHDFHYFTVENGAYINCGTEGLGAHRTTDRAAATAASPLEPVAMSA